LLFLEALLIALDARYPDLVPNEWNIGRMVAGPLMHQLEGLWLTSTVVVIGGGLSMAGIGLLRLQEWGRVLAIALQGFGLAEALFEVLSRGDDEVATEIAPYIRLALGALIVIGLHHRAVRRAFDDRIRRG
jgi:hypothetical protein